MDDLWDLPEEDTSKKLVYKFNIIWDRYLQGFITFILLNIFLIYN